MMEFRQKIELPTTEIIADGGKAKEKPAEEMKESGGGEQRESGKGKGNHKQDTNQESQKAAGV